MLESHKHIHTCKIEKEKKEKIIKTHTESKHTNKLDEHQLGNIPKLTFWPQTFHFSLFQPNESIHQDQPIKQLINACYTTITASISSPRLPNTINTGLASKCLGPFS